MVCIKKLCIFIFFELINAIYWCNIIVKLLKNILNSDKVVEDLVFVELQRTLVNVFCKITSTYEPFFFFLRLFDEVVNFHILPLYVVFIIF